VLAAGLWGLGATAAAYLTGLAIGVAVAVSAGGDAAYWAHGLRYTGAAMSWLVGAEASVVDHAGPARIGFGTTGPAVPAVLVPAAVLLAAARRPAPALGRFVRGAATVAVFAAGLAAAATVSARVATTPSLDVRVPAGEVAAGAVVLAAAAAVVGALSGRGAPGPGRDARRSGLWGAGSGIGTGLLLLGLAGTVTMALVLGQAADGRERAFVAATAPVTLGALAAGGAVVAVGAPVGVAVSPGIGGAAESALTLRLAGWPQAAGAVSWYVLALVVAGVAALLIARARSAVRRDPPRSMGALAARAAGFVAGFAAVIAAAAGLGDISAYAYGEGFVRPSAAVASSVDAVEAVSYAVLAALVAVVVTHAWYARGAALPFRAGGAGAGGGGARARGPAASGPAADAATCPDCGARPRAGARFCGACGLPLDQLSRAP
jgi:hypothetical protein